MTKNKLPKFLLILPIIVIGLFFSLRVFKLNTLPVFVDEAIYIRWSQVMRNEATLRFLPQSDGKQPLFMWLTIPSFKIFSDPVVAGRFVSIASGFGSLIAIALLSYLFFKNKLISLLSAFLYAIVPFSVFFDRMALADSLLAMFGLWTLILAYWFAKTRRLDAAMLLGFAIGGGLLTKSPAIFFYAWTILILIFFMQKPKSLFDWFQLVSGLFATLVISQAMFNILRLGPNFHMITSRNYDYVFPISEVLQHPFNPLWGNLKSTASWLWFLFTPPIIGLILVSPFFAKLKKPILVLFLISISALLSQGGIAKVYTSRYILFASVPLLILAAVSLSRLMTKYHVLFLSLAIWPLISAYGYAYKPVQNLVSRDMRHGYLEEWTAGWGQKEIGDYLVNLYQTTNQKMVVGTEGYFGTLPDGLQIYTQNYPNITVIGVGQPLVNIPDSLKNTSKDNLIFLVVNKSRNIIPVNELEKLTLIKEYPKPNRPNGTQEALQFYQFK